MGRPFAGELERLSQTYNWAKEVNVDDAVRELGSISHLPLLAVGSGGSFSAAELQATFHCCFFKSIAMAVTPLEMISTLPENGEASVWVLSASGNNIDTYRAFQHAALMEPKSVNAVVACKGSKLSRLQERYHYTNVFEYPLPGGKDGFVASNSLLAYSVLLYRFYASASTGSSKLPSTLNKLVKQALPGNPDLKSIRAKTASIWKQRVLHVVYSERLKSVAVDIESKFIETAIGSVHLADMRNFAHGRHHWFDKNPDNSGILFISVERDQELAEKTLNLLPSSLAKGHLAFADLNGVELIAGIMLSLYFTSWRSSVLGIDPGCPGVPGYGSKIYRLTADSGFVSSIKKEEVAGRRKSRAGAGFTNQSEQLKACRQFSRHLSKKVYQGLVLDYDGTVVDSRNRRYPPNTDICKELNRLLAGGLMLGFATGRGKSIRESLQSPGAIKKRHWNQVIIGYYNGAEIGSLADNKCPDQSGKLNGCFDGIPERIYQTLGKRVKITCRRYQVTIEMREPMPDVQLRDIVCEAISDKLSTGISVVSSSHSADILAPGVTKVAVIDHIKSLRGSDSAVLVIGDRGKWPGNDSDLLADMYSLSVNEVSASVSTGWNLCSGGVRGSQGALEYLRRIECDHGQASFR